MYGITLSPGMVCALHIFMMGNCSLFVNAPLLNGISSVRLDLPVYRILNYCLGVVLISEGISLSSEKILLQSHMGAIEGLLISIKISVSCCWYSIREIYARVGFRGVAN